MNQFDELIDRKNSNSIKYDFAVERGRPSDLLPLWVADMDFKTAPCVIERMKKDLDLGVFGYSDVKEEYFEALKAWYLEYFDWKVRKEWLIKTPGVVFALAAAIRAFTKEGDAIIIQQPVYYPFGEMIKKNNRTVVDNSLVLKQGHYEIDFEDFKQKIIREKVTMFILCSPHNPVGRVWKEWELRKLGELCFAHGVIVVSDEIHSDFTYQGHAHKVFANLDQRFSEFTVTCTAPSKTFNLAGLQISNLFVSNPIMKQKLVAAINQVGYSQMNLFGLSACQAAYEGGREWLEELKIYLEGNLSLVRDFVREELPGITLIEPEGTYLVWLDFRALQLTKEEREELIVSRAKLWLDSGTMFGADGEGFERINIACPRSVLRRALEQLKNAM